MPRMIDSPTRFRFTQKALEALPPHDADSPSNHLELCDAEVVGLHLLCSKQGRKWWLLRYRINNRKKSIRIGEFGAFNLKQARDRAWELKAMIAKGHDPDEERSKRAAVPGYETFIRNEYLPHAKATKRSWKTDISRLETGPLAYFKDRRMDSITTRDVSAFHCFSKERTSPSTANRHLVTLSRTFSLAVSWNIVEKNPCVGVKKFPEAPPRERFLTVEESKRLLASLYEIPNPAIGAALRVLFFSGLRLHEVLDLRWEDVDLQKKSFVLRKTKSGKSRTIYPSSAVWNEIEAMQSLRKGKHPCVFPGRYPNRPVNNPTKPFQDALDRAGIPRMRIHDLRHNVASHMVQSGATLYEVQTALGHTTSTMSQRYAHLSGSGMRERAEQVANRLMEGGAARGE